MVEHATTRRLGNPTRASGTTGEGVERSRILIQLRNKPDRDLVQETLSGSYEIILPAAEPALDELFDLAIIDGPNLKRLRSKVRARRKEAEPVFLPILLLSARRKGGRPARHLGRWVDDLILRPLHEDELQARVANLLRRRRLSLDLKKEHDRVVKLSVTDDVSGFYNTRYLNRYLDRRLGAPAVKLEEISLAFFDLDNF